MFHHLIAHLAFPFILIILLSAIGLKLRKGLLVIFFLSLGKETYDILIWKDSFVVSFWDLIWDIFSMFLGSLFLLAFNKLYKRY